jgi:hypothetical protein
VRVFLGLPLGFFAGGSSGSASSPPRSTVTVFLGRPLLLAGASPTDAVSEPFSETTVMPRLEALTCTADRIFCVQCQLILDGLDRELEAHIGARSHMFIEDGYKLGLFGNSWMGDIVLE